MAFVYYNWEDVDINWEALNLNWEEVGFFEDLVTGGVSGVGWAPPKDGKRPKMWYDLKKLNDLPEEKKRIIIKIAAKIEGEEFIEYKYKNDSSINITAEHIQIIINKIENNIKVKIKNIK